MRQWTNPAERTDGPQQGSRLQPCRSRQTPTTRQWATLEAGTRPKCSQVRRKSSASSVARRPQPPQPGGGTTPPSQPRTSSGQSPKPDQHRAEGVVAKHRGTRPPQTARIDSVGRGILLETASSRRGPACQTGERYHQTGQTTSEPKASSSSVSCRTRALKLEVGHHRAPAIDRPH